MGLTAHRFETVDPFLAAAGEFLARREAEHNLIFGICSWLRGNPGLVDEAPSFLTVTDTAGRVVAASLRTPPHNQVLSTVDDAAAVGRLAEALRNEPLPGALGPRDVVGAFADRWTSATGKRWRVGARERIFRLERVIPPPVPPGAWRFLDANDRDLVARWLVAFGREAAPEDPPITDPEGAAERWIAQVGRTGYLWEVDGVPVSLVGAGGETPHGVRIGPVYTPPEHRGRGYASALTAAASQHQLDRGRRFVFLFTDLANPTSNKIYRAIGYEPVIDVDLLRFEADA